MDDIQQRIVVQRADTSRPALSRRPRSGRDVLRNSIISVLTQCESDFIPNDPAPLKLAQYCRKQENTLQKKKTAEVAAKKMRTECQEPIERTSLGTNMLLRLRYRWLRSRKCPGCKRKRAPAGAAPGRAARGSKLAAETTSLPTPLSFVSPPQY